MTNLSISSVKETKMTQANQFRPVVHFMLANLRGSLKDKLIMGIALFTPIFLLLIFGLIGMSTSDGGGNLMQFIFPGIVTYVVVQSGATHAITIVNWREQGVFKRLACTPVPLWQLVLGRSGSHLVLSLLQAALLLVLGGLFVDITFTWTSLPVITVVLAVGSACFIALGTIVSGLSPNANVANTVYLFIIIPLLMFGDALMPANIFPNIIQQVGQYLPTAMIAVLVRGLLTTGAMPDNATFYVAGLLIYTLIFVTLSIRLFRWQ